VFGVGRGRVIKEQRMSIVLLKRFDNRNPTVDVFLHPNIYIEFSHSHYEYDFPDKVGKHERTHT